MTARRRSHRCRAPLRRRAGAGRHRPHGRAGRVLRAARAQRRRQDHADLDPRRPDARRPRHRAHPRPRRRHRLPRRAPQPGRRAAGARLRSVLLGARDARIPGGLLRVAQPGRLDRRDPAPPRPHVEGQRQHALAVGRHEAARAGRPGAGAQAAGDRARRADGRRRRRAAAEPLGVHPQAQSRRPHDHPHDALPRGSRGAVRPHRDAEGGPHRRARLHAEPAVALSRDHLPRSSRRVFPRRGSRAWSAKTRASIYVGLDVVRRARVAAGRVARGEHRDRRAGARGDRPRAGVPADHEEPGARMVADANASLRNGAFTARRRRAPHGTKRRSERGFSAPLRLIGRSGSWSHDRRSSATAGSRSSTRSCCASGR